MKVIKTTFLVNLLLINTLLFSQVGTLSVSVEEQNNELFPIFTYGDEVVMNDEFMRVFYKNKRSEGNPTKQEIEEYVDLYVNFKLKVKEAYAKQLDTGFAFKQELAGYRNQLAKPYLTDKTVTEKLLKQAYERSQQEINAAHLLINCAADAKPVDTLAAYEKIQGLRNRIVNGEDFQTIAFQYSEDPSAKTNSGDLGYFTVFQMIYPFENAAFDTKVGEVSYPIRTRFGYHLVHVKDKRPTQGDIKVAHIAIKYYNPEQVDSTKDRIYAVYEKLQSGENWNDLVKEFSEDFNTNQSEGELGWFNRTTSGIPSEFKDAAYLLTNDGEYSKPIQTKFSWHILKRIEQKKKPTYEESVDFLRKKIERDSRSELNREAVVARIKKENKFVNLAGIDAVKNTFDESLLKGEYTKQQGTDRVLCKIGDREYTDNHFYSYVATNQSRSNQSLENAITAMYEAFVQRINLDYEEAQLEKKYPDFNLIMKEYRDGILLFELMDKEVWTKAVRDTAGLKAYYAAHQEDFMWKERAKITVYSCKNAKTAKKLKNQISKGKNVSPLIEKWNTDDALAVSVESNTIEKGSKKQFENLPWNVGVHDLAQENERYKFVHVSALLPATAKLLEENMGQATSDYQDYLQLLWIDNLKEKYPVEIYKTNIRRLYSNY